MQIQLHNSFKTTQWSGGTTTELFIFPANADFKSGGFKLRLSTATVEIDESVFTKLPNVNRTLVVLEGQMKLEHTNHHQKLLIPFEMDHFSGNWETISKGKCTDFNLMTKGDISSKVSIIQLKAGEQKLLKLDKGDHFFYNYHQPVKLTYNEQQTIPVKSLTQISLDSDAKEISISSMTNCNIIYVYIDNLN
ncbi:HutD/Ves family protein [Fulvivirga lutea]|uniref:HutD family protein n=1 Tax=Fulvivirga lutea TaxID=2810512 RepID=A0A974WJE7_9BACT|nr:HutD family protein [Fulvivirga lutea]QSE98888.1 HutD family protein [Fulvivirga lutea]